MAKGLMAVTSKEPIGVVAIITLWNFPFLIMSQKLPFSLAAGCTCVVKPSELTPASTLMPREILEASGMPAGVVNIIAGHGNPTGNTLIKHPDIEVVSFTGSTRVDQARNESGCGPVPESRAGTGRQESAHCLR
jgi:betaine-aldehyde dehydrogenase